MIYRKKPGCMKILRRSFSFVLAGILLVFALRVSADRIRPDTEAGTLYRLSDRYEMGEVYDRNGKLLAEEKNGKTVLLGKEDEKKAVAALFGPKLEETYASRMTIWGMAPELFGSGDDRLDGQSMWNPFEKRKGGTVVLTIDRDLQTYICRILEREGYGDSAVVVSDRSTGEILASVSLTGAVEDQSTQISNVLSRQYSAGSIMKPILAAAALTIDPGLADFTYDCRADTHDFHTEQGTYHIECAGDHYHGKVGMAEAMACSCNGYFISLLQQLPRERLEEVLKDWGFDTVLKYDQFSYWDQTFAEGEDGANYILAAIGQGSSKITPMGMHLCTNALLNGGELEEPRFIKERSVSPKAPMEDRIRSKKHKICNKETADQVRDMMLGVTDHGTGAGFALPGFAAKTGTAQKNDEEHNTVWTTGGLTDLETPYSVTVVLDQVSKETGSTAAGQIAREILVYLTGGK